MSDDIRTDREKWLCKTANEAATIAIEQAVDGALGELQRQFGGSIQKQALIEAREKGLSDGRFWLRNVALASAILGMPQPPEAGHADDPT